MIFIPFECFWAPAQTDRSNRHWCWFIYSFECPSGGEFPEVCVSVITWHLITADRALSVFWIGFVKSSFSFFYRLVGKSPRIIQHVQLHVWAPLGRTEPPMCRRVWDVSLYMATKHLLISVLVSFWIVHPHPELISERFHIRYFPWVVSGPWDTEVMNPPPMDNLTRCTKRHVQSFLYIARNRIPVWM